MLWVVKLIYLWDRKKENLCGVFSSFSPTASPTLYISLFMGVMGACHIGGMEAHGWVVRFGQPLIGAVSILKLDANHSGSSRMSQAPNLHLAKQLLTNIYW